MKHQIHSRATNRRLRVRHHLKANLTRPRLSVFRSSIHIYAQIIEDTSGKTIVAASDTELSSTSKTPLTKTQKATEVGKAIAQKAQKAKITTIAFDRGAYKYHGRVKALAEAARAGGLEF